MASMLNNGDGGGVKRGSDGGTNSRNDRGRGPSSEETGTSDFLRRHKIPDTPSLSTLPEDIRNMEPDIIIGSPTVVGLLESRCEEWLETIQVAVSYVNSARLVPDDASVFELPLEEIYFWKKRSVYLEPISNQANDRNGHIQWTIRVLGMLSSTRGEKLRESCAALRRLAVEANWNMKYLSILEKPFNALAKGPLSSVYTSIPGMVKTLKMVASSSRFYNSVERIEKLLERITLALCTHAVLETNPSFLIKHEVFESVHPKADDDKAQANNIAPNQFSDKRPIEEPFVTLTRVIETMNKWHVCIAPLHFNIKDKIEFCEGDGVAGNADGKSDETKSTKAAKGNAWDQLNFFRLLVRCDYVKSRCEELRDVFQKLMFYRDDYDFSTLRVNTDESSEKTIQNRRQIVHSILYTLNACTKKRVRPRIGVFPASVEYVFEPRNYSRWSNTLKEIMYLLLKLDSESGSENGGDDKNSAAQGSSNEDDEYLMKKLEAVEF